MFMPWRTPMILTVCRWIFVVVPSGTVRDTYHAGDITVEQVFNSFPLASVGRRARIPADQCVSDRKRTKDGRRDRRIRLRFYDNGQIILQRTSFYCYNPNRMILNKVTDVYLDRWYGRELGLRTINCTAWSQTFTADRC